MADVEIKPGQLWRWEASDPRTHDWFIMLVIGRAFTDVQCHRCYVVVDVVQDSTGHCYDWDIDASTGRWSLFADVES